ncbi:ABC transporter G family member 23-like [Zingiber officinale]|uniref:ABC transporter G family member 23-like n=1 Tax=Zingiber officinale TaxID=94328 RepID=UPI001C4D5956|nr:ABC transporter G family member 23-like [Zingiber officinale]
MDDQTVAVAGLDQLDSRSSSYNSLLSPSSSSFHSSSTPLSSSSTTAATTALLVSDLSYTVLPSATSAFIRRRRRLSSGHSLLKSVSFAAASSELLAVVGPSGAGKSTLLRVISGRAGASSSTAAASISLGGRQLSSAVHLRKLCGFVTQEDNLLPLLTVRETLAFSARLRLRGASAVEREEKVEALVRELGLERVADSYVGDEERRGVSGGERKRVAIGVDVIDDPPLLLLDEPTSGLDSASALQVVQLLAAMARTRRQVVILTIHQPGYRILQHVSTFLLLSHGKVAHYGSLESLTQTIAMLGFTIPTQLNPLEFAMEITQQLEDYRAASAFPPEAEVYYNSKLNRDSTLEAETLLFHSNYCSRLEEIRTLSWRFWKIIYRTKQLFLARTMQAVVGGVGLGSVYLHVKPDAAGVAERLGLFAFSLSFLLSSTVEALPIFLQERRVLMREVTRSTYRLSSYVVANTLVFLPFLFVVALLFAIPVYWLVGLNPSLAAFAFFVLVVWLIVLMASSLVLFLSSISPDFILGNSLICVSLGVFFLFSGYFIPKESIPKYWIFMYYISLYRYPLDSLLINEYWSARDKCFSSSHGGVCLLTGGDVLRARGLVEDSRWTDVWVMCFFFLIYRVMCWILLVRKASRTLL